MKLLRTFSDTMLRLARGAFAEKADEALAEALRALRNTPRGEGKAEVTVTLRLAYQNGRVDVQPLIKSKLPEAPGFKASPFWVTDDGELSLEHPDQLDAFPVEVATARARA